MGCEFVRLMLGYFVVPEFVRLILGYFVVPEFVRLILGYFVVPEFVRLILGYFEVFIIYIFNRHIFYSQNILLPYSDTTDTVVTQQIQ